MKKKGNKAAVNGRSVWGMVWFRFKKNKLAMAGLIILVLMMLAILLMNVTAPFIDYCVVQSNVKSRAKRLTKKN